ncbi:COQ9 family protein [Pelagibius sp. Alg239-R121]|uniref:COQ9 family protein n=1 Tax=Pelagibius sp. Alg239-R121 TaxID=2993448 RepID=UPI0024A6C86D|nr:COQ9 family protein [Pelagibius sp. Alg239-R121]
MTTDKAQLDLLEAALPHIAFDGWSVKAIQTGARDLNMDSIDAQNLFPGGVAELVERFSSHIDHLMMVELEKQELGAMKVRERIATAVRFRLELLEPHREAINRGLTYLAMPQNAQLGLTCLYRTVDAMWFAAGDRATDYNFYSKRLLLAGVYSSTLLYWLNDRSEGHSETWAFLDRRIGEVLKVGGRFGKTMSGVLSLPEKLLERGKRFGQGGGLKARGFSARGFGSRGFGPGFRKR